ncbi:MAG: hypothetical protein HY757_08905 [Nitrospirae bacterium]|nr:hypothetical protein [Nitrospirota bacterium]
MKAEGRKAEGRKAEGRKDLVFVLYIMAVLILAVIYFTVPERKEFIGFQLEWWKEFWRSLVI